MYNLKTVGDHVDFSLHHLSTTGTALVFIAQSIDRSNVLGSSLDRHCPRLDSLSILVGPWQAQIARRAGGTPGVLLSGVVPAPCRAFIAVVIAATMPCIVGS